MDLKIFRSQVTLCRKKHFNILRGRIENGGQSVGRHNCGLDISKLGGYQWLALLNKWEVELEVLLEIFGCLCRQMYASKRALERLFPLVSFRLSGVSRSLTSDLHLLNHHLPEMVLRASSWLSSCINTGTISQSPSF